MREELPISLENEVKLLELAQLIKLARGFRLGIVKCNQPVQRRLLAERLRKMLAGEVNIAEVELKGPVRSLREELRKRLPLTDQRQAIFVYGFEHSIPSEGPAPALEALNFSRELYPREFPYPFVLWLPDYAVTRLAREAPDFWAWRSGVYEFVPEREVMEAVAVLAVYAGETASLPLEAKRERLRILRGLLEDLAELPPGEREERIKGDTLWKAGMVHHELGEYGEARRCYEEALSLFEKLGEEGRVAAVLHQLGMLAQDTGDYAEARRLYQQSLKIAEELGDKGGIAKSLHQLGMLAQGQGDYAEARRLYQESLKIKEELGDKGGVAISCAQLALLEGELGNLDAACELTAKAAGLFKEMGAMHHYERALEQLRKLEARRARSTNE